MQQEFRRLGSLRLEIRLPGKENSVNAKFSQNLYESNSH